MNSIAIRSAHDRCFSDLHKDAYGFRPGPHQFELWNSMNDEQLDAEEAYLYQAIQQSVREEEEAERRAAQQFEAYIAKLMADHSIDRATAIRWDMEAEDVQGYGLDGYRYAHGLPYRYQLN